MVVQAGVEEELHTVEPSPKDGEGRVIVLGPGEAPMWSFNTKGISRAGMVVRRGCDPRWKGAHLLSAKLPS